MNAQVTVVATPHDVVVRIDGVPHLMLKRSAIVGVQGYIKNVGPVEPIYFVEVTTTSEKVVADYKERETWTQVLEALAQARVFDERLGERE